MRVFKTTILILLCTVLAHANDTALVAVGGSLRPMRGEHASIRMVREHVQVELHGNFYRTRVDFEFQNMANRAVTVTMGFPESGGGDVDATAARRRTQFRRFATWVDGRPVTARRIFTSHADEEMYQAFWTKQVSFAPRGSRRVRVEYESPMSGTVTDEFTRFVPYEFTGGNWRGQVAESRLTVRVLAPGRYILRARQSSNGSENTNAVTEMRFLPLTRDGDSFTHIWRNWEAEASFDLGVMATVPGGLSLEGGTGMFSWFDAFGQTAAPHDDGRQFITVPPANSSMRLEDYDINIYPPIVRRGSRLFIALPALRFQLDRLADAAGQRDATELMATAQGTIETLRAGRHTMEFRMGSATMRHNTRPVTMPEAAFEISGSPLYVPLESVLQILSGEARPDENGERIRLNIPAFW